MSVEGVETERTHGRPILGSFNALFSVGGLLGGAAGTAAAGAGMDPRSHFLAAALLLAVVGGAATSHFEGAAPTAPHRLLVVPTRAVVLLGMIAFCGFLAEGIIQDWAALSLRRVAGATPAWKAG